MPNKNYSRGYAIERKAFKELEEEGYYPIRSSGSHTKIDLVALPTTNLDGRRISDCPILAIQLKRVKGKYYSFKKEIEEIEKIPLSKTVNGDEFIRKEIWIYKDRLKGIRKAGWTKKVIRNTTSIK